jgi:predicted amidophosphoribosyltransferase
LAPPEPEASSAGVPLSVELPPPMPRPPEVAPEGGNGSEKPEVERGQEKRRNGGILAQIVGDVEKVWLGQITPPLAERMSVTGWVPDAPGAFCGRCGRTAGQYEADASGCPACRGTRFPWDRVVRLGELEGLLRDVIHEVKYTRWRRLGEDLGRLLGRSLAEEMRRCGMRPDRAVLVPMPTSFWRRMQRGIDHPLVIARGVARETGIPIRESLSRMHRPTQQSLPASRRAANVSGAIRARRWADLKGMDVILVDDVTTTRATLLAAARPTRALMKADGGVGDGGERGNRVSGAGEERRQLWAAVLAVTSEPGRSGSA